VKEGAGTLTSKNGCVIKEGYDMSMLLHFKNCNEGASVYNSCIQELGKMISFKGGLLAHKVMSAKILLLPQLGAASRVREDQAGEKNSRKKVQIQIGMQRQRPQQSRRHGISIWANRLTLSVRS
jgi:hypothetical protein